MSFNGHRVTSFGGRSAKVPALERKLGLAEAVGLSLSIVGPTMAMAFNVSLVVRAAGSAAPLAFAIGALALSVVALSFVSFSRRVAHAGSAYAYIGYTFGWRWGFVAGWTLLLTYLTYAAGVSALIGNFLQAAAQNSGIHLRGLWLAFSVAGLLLAGFCAYRDVKLAGRLMLLLEGISVFAILFLCVVVLIRVGASHGFSAEPFIPVPGFKAWSGIGYALVFCVLSFAGFEGATTLGEETRNPHRSIPIAILATCALAGVFYVFVTYAQVIGFGIGATTGLANSSAPLNELAVRYVSRPFATAIDLAAAISAFSCALGSLTAASRLLFALGRDRLGLQVAPAHLLSGGAGRTVVLCSLFCLALLLLWAPSIGPTDYCGYLVTIGSLALILVYIGVNAAELTVSFRARRTAWSMCGLAGTGVLFWPLYNSLYPVPSYPNNRWPYFVGAWVIGGVALPFLFPVLRTASYRDARDVWKSKTLPSPTNRESSHCKPHKEI